MAGRFGLFVRNNVVGFIALFIALGAGAYAAGLPKDSVKSKQIKAGAVKNSDLADDAVTSPKVADGSLLGKDFAPGQLPAGSPDTPQDVLGKLAQVDGPGSGLDADQLDGVDSSVLGTAVTYLGEAFKTRTTTTQITYVANGRVWVSGGSDSSVVLPVYLPQGAKVTRLTFDYIDNGPAEDDTLFFSRVAPGTSFTDLTQLDTSGTSTAVRSTSQSLSPPPVIDNTTNAYLLTWAPAAQSVNHQLAGVTIEYSLK
jgi:hypothetical protein